MTRNGDSVTGKNHALSPVATRYAAGACGLMVAVFLLIAIADGVAPGHSVAYRPIAVFAGLAIVTLVCLAAVVVIASHLGGAGNQSPGASPELPDPATGLLRPFSEADSDEETALRFEQAQRIFDQLSVMMAINVANALLVAAVLWDQVNLVKLGVWMSIVLGVAAIGFLARARTRNIKNAGAVSKRTLRRISLHAGTRGLLWGACFALFFGDAGPTGQLVLLSVSLGMLAGGVPALALVPSAALLFGLGVTVPTLLRLLSLDGNIYLVLAMFALTFSASMVTVGCQLYRNFASNVLAERRHAEQSATISLLLKEVETSTSDWLWETDGQLNMVRLPDRMRDVFGCGRQPNNVATLLDVLATVQPGSVQNIVQLMCARTAFRDVVVETIDADGLRRWVSLTASPNAKGGYRGVGSDITARMVARADAEAALLRARKAEQRLNDGIDALGAGFILSDSADQTIIANKRFAQLFPVNALLEPTAKFGDIASAQAELWQPHRPFPARNWLTDLLEKRTINKKPFDIQLPDRRWMRVEGCATSEGGIVTVLTDVTDIKEQEAALALQTQRLAASNQDLQQFAAVASHDLQEPLRKIETFGARLKAKAGSTLDVDSAAYLDRMLSATTRMRRLITDLLAFSRAAKSDAKIERLDLDRLAAEVLDDLTVTIEEQKATLDVRPLGAMQGNSTLVRQLLQNLISNALKFSKPDVAPQLIIERRDLANETFELRLTDNGIGFDMKHHDAIFEIFQRLHGREQFEGTGIGLATCRKICERQGGSIRAESVPGKGSVFILTFPVLATTGRSDAA